MTDTNAPHPRIALKALQTLKAAGITSRAFLRFGEPCLSVEHAGRSLVVSLSGAQILEWSPGDCNNPLWSTDEKLHRPGNPIRGGIPLCWPWFGAPHAPFHGPSHGFGRRRCWELSAATQQAESFSLRLALKLSAPDLPDRFQLKAEYSISVSDVLALHLRTTNLGDEACPVTPAFHPYFAVRELARTRLHFAAPVAPFDRLAKEHRDVTRTLTFDGSETEVQWAPWTDVKIDRGPDEGVLEIKSDAMHCVAWNPGPEKTSAIDDLHADAFNRFIGVEPGRLDANRATIPPGGESSISMTLRVAR